MDLGRSPELAHESPGSLEKVVSQSHALAPSLFRHKELMKAVETAQGMDQPSLTNMINHIHFTDGSVRVLMAHPQFKETILFHASPQPCMGNTVTCLWRDETCASLNLQKLEFLYLVIDDGRSMIMVPGAVKEMTQEHVVIDLPERSFALRERQAKRYACYGVEAELVQNGFHAKGALVDFSPVGFRVRVRPEPSCSFRWLNSIF